MIPSPAPWIVAALLPALLGIVAVFVALRARGARRRGGWATPGRAPGLTFLRAPDAARAGVYSGTASAGRARRRRGPAGIRGHPATPGGFPRQ